MRGGLLGTAFQSQLNEKQASKGNGIHKTIVTDTEVVPIHRLIMFRKTAQEDQRRQPLQQHGNSNFQRNRSANENRKTCIAIHQIWDANGHDGTGD